jgi:hypothetical protein
MIAGSRTAHPDVEFCDAMIEEAAAKAELAH